MILFVYFLIMCFEISMLCLQNTSEGPAESSFNFDYVSKEYGPGAGYIFLSAALTTVGTAIFGGTEKCEFHTYWKNYNNMHLQFL